MEYSEVLRRRRMVRRFRPDPVPPDLLDKVLASAQRAPSAGFAQGLGLVVLQGPEQTSGFWTTTDPRGRKRPGGAGDPPVLILPLADKQAYLDRYSEPDKAGTGMHVESGWPVAYWELDAAMSVMLMLLTAVDVGLGAWFFGIFHGERELLQRLGIPDGLKPIGAVGLGYPNPEERRRGSALSRHRKRLDEIVHRGRW